MRHVYMDEAGIGNPKDEPYTVVSGVMIHVDTDYEPARKYLTAMADDLIGVDRPPDFSFHAKDIWHGKKHFSGDKWKDVGRRRAVLMHLAEMIVKFQFPIIYSCVYRADHVRPSDPTLSRGEIRKLRANGARYCHMISYISCLHQTELFMRDRFSAEKVFLIIEQHRDHASVIQEVTSILRDPETQKHFDDNPSIEWAKPTHLVEEPMFVEKSLGNLCQLADATAFIISRALAGKEDIQPFLEMIKPNLVSGFVKEFIRLNDNQRS